MKSMGNGVFCETTSSVVFFEVRKIRFFFISSLMQVEHLEFRPQILCNSCVLSPKPSIFDRWFFSVLRKYDFRTTVMMKRDHLLYVHSFESEFGQFRVDKFKCFQKLPRASVKYLIYIKPYVSSSLSVYGQGDRVVYANVLL